MKRYKQLSMILILLIFFVFITGCQEQAEPLELSEEESETIAGQIPEVETAEEVQEPEEDEDCNIILCIQDSKELYCTDSFIECAEQYDECRMVSCDPELASEQPVTLDDSEACASTRNLCRIDIEPDSTTGDAAAYKEVVCVGTYTQCKAKYDNCQCGAPTEEKCCCFTEQSAYQLRYISDCNYCVASQKCEPSQEEEVVCEDKKHTCYYQTDPVSTETQYIDSTVAALTCYGSYTHCVAKYGDCECGLKMDYCDEDKHNCFKGTEMTVCSGNLDFCLRRNDDCTCGKFYGCEERTHKCYIRDIDYLCSGEYDDCARRYDKCLCGKPGVGCTGKGHRCYNSVQTTTEYEVPEEEICDDYYYECAKQYDHCDCGTEEPTDYSCPLKQHSCRLNGVKIVCNGDYDECVEEYGSCDCGVQTVVYDLP